ncbi:MAG TPA: farnesyl diphosphate synthase [Thermodesulfovibrionales bacterium]|nr:farnesyl diphosphate synthase [Thermodesulfovibrionales bacterium]
MNRRDSTEQNSGQRQIVSRIDIKTYLRDKRDLIDSFLRSHFSMPLAPATLNDAMVYSLFAGGKRLRPILALASYEACGGDGTEILPYVASLELIHTYSLVHDDLPAMDDDDLRRGKPTNHKVFGEGMAILAGDALLTEAFSLLSDSSRLSSPSPRGVLDETRSRIPPSAVLKVIGEVSMAAGAHGMVGGQAEDLLSEDAAPESEKLSFIHSHKTGALITVSVRMGAILARAGKKNLRALTRYGENIGLAFQIIDDILDIQGNTGELGKTTGSDEKKKKMTYPGLYGIDRSAKKAEELVEEAVGVLQSFRESADPLREIALYITKRRT